MSAVEPYRVDGGIMVPKYAEGTDAIGVAYVLLKPDSDEYGVWDWYLRKAQPRGVGKWKQQR